MLFKVHIYILTLVLAVQFSWSQKISVHFEGTVFNENNIVLKGAEVEVVRGVEIMNALKSDENGAYNVYLPLDGEFMVTVSSPGYVHKKYFVSTKNIPEDKSNIAFATNVADVVLHTRHEGIDYGFFDQPMNMYAYHPIKDNVHYDEDYLNKMREGEKAFYKRELELLAAMAKEANDLAAKKKKEEEEENQRRMSEERLTYEKALLEKMDAEARELKKTAAEGKKDQKPDTIATQTVTRLKSNLSDGKMTALLAHYPQGVTEETFSGDGVYVIRRVVVKNERVWVYQKKIFSWGGVSCFRDQQAIPETVFEAETKKP